MNMMETVETKQDTTKLEQKMPPEEKETTPILAYKDLEGNDIVDFESMLFEDELMNDSDGGSFIPLAALERLARIKGIHRITPVIVSPPHLLNLMAVVQVEIEWADGTITGGCGDAHAENVDGDFASYLTSMAETRAKARALRAGLGITICSREEVAETKTREDLGNLKNISAAQVTLISKLLAENEMNLQEVSDKFPDKFKNITTVEDLTQSQALGMIKWLQTGKQRKSAKKNK